jgi:hypothetical protein
VFAVSYNAVIVCEDERIRSRAVMLHCTSSLTDPGSNPGAGTVNQTVHPSGVDKFVAICVQRVTAVESCLGKIVRLSDGWRMAYASDGANYHTLVS